MTDDQRAKLMMYHRVPGVVTTCISDFPAPFVPNLLTGLLGRLATSLGVASKCM